MKRIIKATIVCTSLLLISYFCDARDTTAVNVTNDRFNINVAISGAPLYAFYDASYGMEHFYDAPEVMESIYTGNIKSRTFGTYSVDAAYRLGKRWAVLLNVGYSLMKADYYDPATHDFIRNETDNIFSILAGGRFYWKDKPKHKIYSSLYLGLMLHNRSLDYWEASEYPNQLLGWQVTFLGWQFGRKRIYGLIELGVGELSMGVPMGMRVGVGYRFNVKK